MQRTTTQLRSYDCPNCAAPLEVVPGVDVVKCLYCHHSIQVRRTPAPPQALSPEAMRFILHIPHDDGRTSDPSHPTFKDKFDKFTSTSAGIAIVTLGVLAFLAILGIVMISLNPKNRAPKAASGKKPASSSALASAGPVSLPLTCFGGRTLTIESQTYTLRGVALNAYQNCKVTIKHSQITGSIDVSDGAEVTIEDSDITSEDSAIAMKDLSTLTLTNTTVHSSGVGIQAGDNARVTMNGSKLFAKGDGIRASYIALALIDSQIQSDAIGIDGHANAVVTVDDQSAVSGATNAMHLKTNGDLKCNGAITSDHVAIRADFNANLNVSRGCIVTGKTTAIESVNNLTLIVDGSLVSDGTAIDAGDPVHIAINESAVIDAPIAWLPGNLRSNVLTVSPSATLLTGNRHSKAAPMAAAAAAARAPKPPPAPAPAATTRSTCSLDDIAAGKRGCM
jgi:hypothetical protein